MCDETLSYLQKLNHYKYPDYCFVVNFAGIEPLIGKLKKLIDNKAIYFSIFSVDTFSYMFCKQCAVETRNLQNPESSRRKLDLEQQKDVKKMIVIYFNEDFLDTMAEHERLKTKMSEYDCVTEFKSHASDMFEQFDPTSMHMLMMRIFNDNFNMQ